MQREMTAAELRRILVDHVLRGSQRPPSEAAIRVLAGSVSAAIREADNAVVLRRLASTAARCADALEVLAETLPELRCGLDEGAETAILDRLTEAVGAARRQGWATRVAQPVVIHDRWHAVVAGLGDALREAMRSTNPDLDLGLSNSGPVVRFLEQVIFPITGECPPTRDAIARHLQRSSRGNNADRSVTPSPG
jgi:hypothetical protein